MTMHLSASFPNSLCRALLGLQNLWQPGRECCKKKGGKGPTIMIPLQYGSQSVHWASRLCIGDNFLVGPDVCACVLLLIRAVVHGLKNGPNFDNWTSHQARRGPAL